MVATLSMAYVESAFPLIFTLVIVQIINNPWLRKKMNHGHPAYLFIESISYLIGSSTDVASRVSLHSKQTNLLISKKIARHLYEHFSV